MPPKSNVSVNQSRICTEPCQWPAGFPQGLCMRWAFCCAHHAPSAGFCLHCACPPSSADTSTDRYVTVHWIQLFVSRFPCKDGGFLTSTWLKRPATGHFQPPSQLLLGYLQYNFSPFKNQTEFAEFNETQKRYQAAISLRQICSAWRACLEDLLFDDIKDHRRIFLYGEGHWIESSPNCCLLLEQRSFTLL